MKRSGKVFVHDVEVGMVWEDDNGFSFQYHEGYIKNPIHGEVSKTLPLINTPYVDKNILPFFDGLIPEGWLLDIAAKNWKLEQRDRIGLLLTVCHDCIGAVSIKSTNEK